MKAIDYFKLQAKNLFKDYKTQTPYSDSVLDGQLYTYNPKYFDVDGIVLDFNIDEDDFSLMNAQHVIAQLAGFSKWTEMLKASEIELELAKLLFDNQHKVSVEEWEDYITSAQLDTNIFLSPKLRLEIFKQVFANVDGHESFVQDYRLNPNSEIKAQSNQTPPVNRLISALPLKPKDRAAFVEAAEKVFETVFARLNPLHPELTRKLWNSEYYIDEVLLKQDMLPIDYDYVLSLIDASLVHHVIDLATDADLMAVNLN
ncbi:hypothetical protein KXD93_25605 [Mucilaginibacter sp. BJC16-A38]|uniref:hypothetical protein n=1 Tax=Mucilaginibacter phenanthrenivorans TaxID=1234842 RepID=UPI00215745EF|nr:hypothetical protein [Mucilaginibacter phenanthrenivorans]MCR8561059.1 hypothetical protein [Mucilaginibacter phenanthrenivorans]